MESATEHDAQWLRPVSAEEPCGPSLEYDHEYAVLLSRLAARPDAQYGSFVGTPEPVNWGEIERDARRLLLRSKDISLLVCLCRARTRLGQAAGLAHVLSMLRDVLEAWPEAVHPQLLIEGQPEPSVRANALAGLADPEGLLADVGEIVVSANTALRLTVRDVERAFAVPRLPDALNAAGVTRQLADLRAAVPKGKPSPLRHLEQAAAHLHAINHWSQTQLGYDAPSLLALSRMLDHFIDPLDAVQEDSPAPVAAPVADHAAPASKKAASAMHSPAHTTTASRDEVLASICAARQWFEDHEPSSPVAVLLKQAERMVGKRFSQVADSIPLELLRKWEDEGAQEAGSGA